MPEPEPQPEPEYGTANPEPQGHSALDAESQAHVEPEQAASAANLAPGVTSKCAEYYNVRAGDFCFAIVEKFGTTFERLRELNTNIDENCSNLWKDYAYCVRAQ